MKVNRESHYSAPYYQELQTSKRSSSQSENRSRGGEVCSSVTERRSNLDQPQTGGFHFLLSKESKVERRGFSFVEMVGKQEIGSQTGS